MKSIVIDADAATGVARFDFEHLTPNQKFDLSYGGPGICLSVTAGREDADHRTRRRLGRFTRTRFREQRHYRRGDQSDHCGHDHEEDVPAIQQPAVFPSRSQYPD